MIIEARKIVLGSLLLLFIFVTVEAPLAGTTNNNCEGKYINYRIKADSMRPLLEKGNYIKVFSKKAGPEYCFAIERGGIYTYISNTFTKDIYVHRIIGLPGDTIEQNGKSLIVNGKVIEQTFVEKLKIKTSEYEVYKETIGGYEFNSMYKSQESFYMTGNF